MPMIKKFILILFLTLFSNQVIADEVKKNIKKAVSVLIMGMDLDKFFVFH